MTKTERFVRMQAMALIIAVTSICGTAAATSGVIQVGLNMTLTEDHYGTLVLSEDSYLNCNYHSIYNDVQAPVCWDENSTSQFRCGIFAYYVDGVDIVNCNIHYFDQAITILGGSDIWIRGTYIASNGDGVHAAFTWPGIKGLFLAGSDVSWNSDEGIKLYNTYKTEIITTWVWWNTVDGIDGDWNSSPLIKANNMRENGDHAIEFDDDSYVTVDGNYIDGYYPDDGVSMQTVRDGIQLERVNNFTVKSNTVRDVGRNGIYLNTSTNGTVTSNNVSGSSTWDCRRSGGSGVTFSSNTFGTQTSCP